VLNIRCTMRPRSLVFGLPLLISCAASEPPVGNSYNGNIVNFNAPHEVGVTPPIQAVVDAPDRAPEDRAHDGDRHPGEVLSYFGVKPEMHVAVIAAGSGYSAELLARAVGPAGVVYAQNTPALLDRLGAEAAWSARLQKPVNQRITRVDRPFEDPLPPDARNLDVVILLVAYHELVALHVDRERMNAAIFRALKPGGIYGVIDHSAREDANVESAVVLHRIESHWVRDEVKQAGFTVFGEGDFLHNAADPRDTPSTNPDDFWSGKVEGPSDDRFVLRFIKPQF
jgi:predicted methyltransferase